MSCNEHKIVLSILYWSSDCVKKGKQRYTNIFCITNIKYVNFIAIWCWKANEEEEEAWKVMTAKGIKMNSNVDNANGTICWIHFRQLALIFPFHIITLRDFKLDFFSAGLTYFQFVSVTTKKLILVQ